MNKQSDPLEENHDELYLTEIYALEAFRCEEGKAYLAGCIMLGAAIEAELYHLFKENPDALKRAKALCKKYKTESKDSDSQTLHEKILKKKLHKLGLYELIVLACSIRWLPTNFEGYSDFEDWCSNGEIGDLIDYVRNMRNFIHPSKYKAQFDSMKNEDKQFLITEDHFSDCFSLFEMFFDHLFIARVKREEKIQASVAREK